MDSYELKQWVINNNIREKTVKGFWESFDIYKSEDPEEYKEVFDNFDKTLLILSMNKVSLTILCWDKFSTEYSENEEFVEAVLDIKYKGSYIGYYKLIFNFDGIAFDDFFVLE